MAAATTKVKAELLVFGCVRRTQGHLLFTLSGPMADDRCVWMEVWRHCV